MTIWRCFISLAKRTKLQIAKTSFHFRCIRIFGKDTIRLLYYKFHFPLSSVNTLPEAARCAYSCVLFLPISWHSPTSSFHKILNQAIKSLSWSNCIISAPTYYFRPKWHFANLFRFNPFCKSLYHGRFMNFYPAWVLGSLTMRWGINDFFKLL